MMKSIVHRVAGIGLVALIAGACASSGGPGASSAPRKNLTAADSYPLASGWKWAYDVEKDGMNILATYVVLERSGDVVSVQAGDERLSYAVTAEGVAQREDGRIGDYIIRNPVQMGAEWPVAGGRAKIVATGQEISLEPAGKFEGCVVVEVTRTDPVRIARTTYAPDVGPVAIELQVQDGQRFVTSTRARLRAVTKPGEDALR
jgi:hypothetical protein